MTSKRRFVIFGLVSLLAVGLCTGHVFAAYAVTDNANSFGVAIRATMEPRTVTFHMPDADDATCSSYNDEIASVEYATTLAASQDVPETSSFLGFTFGGWYLENTFENAFSTSTPITTDLDLYAKYTRSNVLFDGTSSYFVSNNTAQTVDSQFIYTIDTQTWGVIPATSNENKIDLISPSGVYKMTYSSGWTILRKIVIHANGIDWLASDDALMYAYGQNEDTSSWGDVYWGGTPSVNGVTLNGSAATGEVYIDYSKRYIGVVRDDNDIELDSDSNRPFNSWKPADLLSGYQYSKFNIHFYLTNTGGYHGKNAPSWGDGN